MRLELGSWRRRLARLRDRLLDQLDPQQCLGCGARFPYTDGAGLLLCRGCSADLRQRCGRCTGCGLQLPEPLAPQRRCGPCSVRTRAWDQLLVLGDYVGPLADVVQAFKFRGWFFLGERLGRELALEIRAAELGAEAVVAVPMPWWRRYRRGLDHTRILAAEIAATLHLPLLDPLWRAHGVRFSTLSARGRRRAPPTFRLRRGAKLPATVLLVDDIVTTGATLETCARLLRGAGARRVVVATIARTLSPRERLLQQPESPVPHRGVQPSARLLRSSS